MDKKRKVGLRLGGVMRILTGPDGDYVKAKVEMLNEQYIWVRDILWEHPELAEDDLTIQLAEENRSMMFTVRVDGREILDKIPMTRLLRLTAPVDANQRQAYRLPLLFDVTVKRRDQDAGDAVKCQGLDISETGLGFATEKPFIEGEQVECSFALGDERYRLMGKVVRIVERENTGRGSRPHRIGVLFLGMTEGLRRRLRSYIYAQQAERQRQQKRKNNL